MKMYPSKGEIIYDCNLQVIEMSASKLFSYED